MSGTDGHGGGVLARRALLAVGAATVLGSGSSPTTLGDDPAVGLRGVILAFCMGLGMVLAGAIAGRRSRPGGGRAVLSGVIGGVIAGLVAFGLIEAVRVFIAPDTPFLHPAGPLHRGLPLALLCVGYTTLPLWVFLKLRHRGVTGTQGIDILPWVGLVCAVCDLSRFLPLILRNPASLAIGSTSLPTSLGLAVGVVVAGSILFPIRPPVGGPDRRPFLRRLMTRAHAATALYLLAAAAGWFPLGIARMEHLYVWRRELLRDPSLRTEAPGVLVGIPKLEDGATVYVVSPGTSGDPIRVSVLAGTDRQEGLAVLDLRGGLAAVSVRKNGDTIGLEIVRLPGGATVSRLLADRCVERVALSPDLTRVAVQSVASGVAGRDWSARHDSRRLAVCDTGSGECLREFTGIASDRPFCWFGDSRRLLYTRVGSEGGACVTDTETGEEVRPAWDSRACDVAEGTGQIVRVDRGRLRIGVPGEEERVIPLPGTLSRVRGVEVSSDGRYAIVCTPSAFYDEEGWTFGDSFLIPLDGSDRVHYVGFTAWNRPLWLPAGDVTGEILARTAAEETAE